MQNTLPTIDTNRLLPYTIGFDDLFDRLFDLNYESSGHGYPPYNIVKLDDNLSLKLKYPSMKQFIESNFEAGVETVSNTMDVVISSIDMIYNEEESWNASESTKKELEDFIDQLNTKQFKLIENFFDTMPKLSHKIKVKNPKTNVESTVLLEGLAAFFN